MVITIDISGVLFPTRELTLEELNTEERKGNLWNQAQQEANRTLQGRVPFSPLALVKEAHKLYLSYLVKEGLNYDEQRGF